MAMEEADWDLLAVVRGFTSTVTEAIQQPTPPPPPADHGGLISPSGYYEQPLTADGFQENKEAQLIFGNRASSPADASVFTLTSHLKPTATCSTPSQTHQRSKKRKSLQKRVCHVPVEGLSSDMWAWRKYGQKPIKGSPYPRGYYKCSSSKECPARKQVERNKSEPKMLIVAYTSEHNHPLPTHRNSLAGSTRQKPNVEVAHKVDQENIEPGDELELKQMVMNDDFFVGFEDLNDDSDCGDLFSHQIQGNLEERESPPPL